MEHVSRSNVKLQIMTIAVLTTALLSATFAGTGKTLLAKAVATESGPARESLRYFFFLQHSSHFIILHIIVYIFFQNFVTKVKDNHIEHIKKTFFSKQTLDLEGHFSPHRLSTLHGFAWYLDPLNTNIYMVDVKNIMMI